MGRGGGGHKGQNYEGKNKAKVELPNKLGVELKKHPLGGGEMVGCKSLTFALIPAFNQENTISTVEEVICLFHRTLVPLQFEQLCSKTRKAQKQERQKKLEQRSSLVLGINQVTKALEKGTLKLVLVRFTEVTEYWCKVCTIQQLSCKISWNIASCT